VSVCVALLSEEIRVLTEHCKKHAQDHGSRRGLIMKVSRRKSLLNYLERKDANQYKKLISQLGLRK